MTWLIVLVLTALLLFVFYRPRDFDEQAQNKLNLDIYKQRHDELQASHLGDEDKQLLLLELDKELLAQQQKAQDFAQNAQAPVWFIPLLSVFVLLCAYVFYGIWGAQKELETTALIAKASESVLSDKESQELIKGMRNAAQKHPKKLEWQYLLGQFLNADAQYKASAEVFSNLLKQLPEDAKEDRAATLSDLAQARFFANNQKASPEDYQLLEESLKLMPNRMGTLGIAGMVAFELERFEQAIKHWRKIWQQLQQGPEAKALEKGITTAAKRLELQGKKVDISWLVPVQLNVTLSLSEKAKANAKSEDVIFVIIQQTNGSAVPLAAQKLQVKDLPRVVRLTQAQVMLPSVNLADFKEVKIVARLSKSGGVKAQKGDWQGELLSVNTKESKLLNLEINRELNP